jgi:metal-dependent hydrolase (beta-lactamase superfamily II)
MNFIRTFHPVGHGNFYTEEHTIDGKKFTIVYDCGSMSITEAELKKKIETTFHKNQVIDILFISHFHKDHINGIKYLKNHCTVKRVVMPYIDTATKVLSLIPERINGDYNFELATLLDNPAGFFKAGTEITQIKEFSESKEQDGPSTIEISDDNKMPSGALSGTKFLATKIDCWYYIPYNFNAGTKGEVFLKKLEDSGVKIKKENNTMKIIDEYWDKIKKAYEETFNKKVNESSMVLFSGKDDKNDMIFCTCNGHSPSKKINSGCLYTGDVNLNGKVSDIKKSMDKTKFRLFDSIGTLQVPHHGSIHNFDRSVLDNSNIKCAVISYGTTNDYGHPSIKVIEDLRVKRICDHHVTECQSSIVIQVKNTQAANPNR